jgi:DNA-binding NtrC family response regulator
VALEPLYETLRTLEHADPPSVLLVGEHGTGKSLLARMIHARGPRRDRPFVVVDCAALPASRIDGELFGHDRGLSMDTNPAKGGAFEVADTGVILLRNVDALPRETQSTLLGALEDHTYLRVGGTRPLPLRAAVLATTRRDLRREVSEGRFLADLDRHLHAVEVHVPALRERISDVHLLVAHFLDRFNRQFGRHVAGIAPEAMDLLQRYAWPGNVRELRNVIERLVLLAPGDRIRPEHLPPELRLHAGPGGLDPDCPFELPPDGVDLEAVERGLIQQALIRCGSNQSAAARSLGISRFALRYRMEKFDLHATGERGR